MKLRGKRFSKKTKNVSPTRTKESLQNKVVSSDEVFLSTANDDIVNLPPPLTTTIDEIESGEDSISLKDNSVAEENVVSPNENIVTIPLSAPPPEYLIKDPISCKFVFDFGKFDYSTEITKFKLNKKDYVKYLSWKEFNKDLSKLMSSYYSSLLFYYKYGLSAKLQRDFCLAVAMNLPLCERKYRKLRKQSAKGLLSPDLSDTVKKQLSLSAHRLEAAVLVRLELIYGPNACEPIYYHRQLAYMVKEEVESDLIIRDLLCVLLMFRPPDLDGTENFGLGVQPSTSTSLMAYSSNSTTSNTTSNTTPTSRYPEFIRYQYHSYCHLLRQYLGHKYAPNARKAAERYSRLMVIVSEVATFKTAAISAVALQERVDVTQCSHLLAEIYFLKDGVPGLGGGQGSAGGLTAGGGGGDHRHDRGGDGTGGGGGGGGNGGGSINDGRNSYVNENSYSSHGSSGSNGGGGSSGSNGGGNGDNGNGGGGGGGNGERKNGCSLSPLEDRKFGIAAF